MTYLVERLAELRRHVDHVRTLVPRLSSPEVLARDLSLHNDVMFSLLMISQLVIDVAGELAARRGDRFEDYTEAVRSLGADTRFPSDLVRALEPLPGFRNIVIHEYVALDPARVIEAARRLEPVERFIEIVADIEENV
jgi:uncharacterized protein YutE (UPF0331/DUF86 family)